MEDVTGWYSSQIRKGVYTDDGKLNPMSIEFKEWLRYRSGRVVIQYDREHKQPNETEGADALEAVIVNYPKTLVYFEKQEDLVDYLLTFEEMPMYRREVDVAAFYCPYVPLTVTTIINYSNVQPVTFNTRYSMLKSVSVYRPGDSDSSV
jgi:hypothetical protein